MLNTERPLQRGEKVGPPRGGVTPRQRSSLGRQHAGELQIGCGTWSAPLVLQDCQRSPGRLIQPWRGDSRVGQASHIERVLFPSYLGRQLFVNRPWKSRTLDAKSLPDGMNGVWSVVVRLRGCVGPTTFDRPAAMAGGGGGVASHAVALAGRHVRCQ